MSNEQHSDLCDGFIPYCEHDDGKGKWACFGLPKEAKGCLACYAQNLEAEVERLRALLVAADHLLLAATGPDGGPTNWDETFCRWRDRLAQLGLLERTKPAPDPAKE